MADFNSYNVALITIQADEELPVYLTNHHSTLLLDGKVWIPSPEINVDDLPDKSGGLGSADGNLKSIKTAVAQVLTNIAGGYPYNQIEVTVAEAVLDDSLALVSMRTHFTGLVYQSKPFLTAGFLDLVLKGWKYYTDIIGGVACTEYCFVKHFGDQMCQASVAEYPVTIDSVSGNLTTLDSVPVVQDFLFNKGFFKYNGTSIKVKYWESGLVFQTSEAVPADWVGQSVSLVVGCDKTLTTCRDIHDNEEHFSGWGYSMIDYDPRTEDGS